jgi:Holliday junction DNA helicase RuvA
VIGKLKGRVDSVGEDETIIDVGGVGYVVAASARTLRSLPAVGEPVTLHIETQVREDAIRLFGFLTTAERDWFRLLQSVQGVGAKVALGILGALPGDALVTAIARQDKAPALGAADFGVADLAPSGGLPKPAEDAVLALTGLGYARVQAAAAVSKAMKTMGAEAATAALIRAGLKELAQ